MKIHLIRHGRTEANQLGLYYGATDLPLSPVGMVELETLRSTRKKLDAKMYLTSSKKRAKQTLKILFDKTPCQVLPELDEFDFGQFEMKSYEQLRDRPDYQRWIHGGPTASCPGGESTQDFLNRILIGYKKLLDLSVSEAVVICHGGTISHLLDHLFPNEKDHLYAWLPDCGCGYTLTSAPTLTWEVVSY